jgi:plastocyanin
MTPVYRRALLLSVTLTSLLLGAGACGSGGSKSSETTTSGGQGEPSSHGTTNVAGKDEVKMELDDFYFGPTVLVGKPGQTLKIELENEGNTEHNFSVDSQKIDKDVEQGEDATVSVTFPQSGKLQFYCSYHRAKGMIGTLRAQ